MYSVPATGGTVERADTLSFYDTEWSFNPTNMNDVAATVDFGTGCVHGSYLARIDRASGTYTLLRGGGNITDRSPSWSPNGTKIAFISGDWTTSTTRNIFVYDVATTNVTQLTFNTGESIYGSISDLNWGRVSGNANSVYPDSLIIPSATPCDNNMVQPIAVRSFQSLRGFNVTLKIPAGVIIDSVKLASAITGWNDYSVVKPDSGFVQLVAVATGTNSLSQTDSIEIFRIYYKAPPRLCRTDWYIHWDTALSNSASRALSFTNASYATIYPEFDRLRDSVRIKGYDQGNVNGTGLVDIADLSALVSYLTGGGYVLCIQKSADVNNAGSIPDISDLSALVSYLTGGGWVLPTCGGGFEGSGYAKLATDIILHATYAGGKTIISLENPIDLSAAHIVVGGTVTGAVNANAGKYDLLQGSVDGVTNLILIDLKGKNFIKSGKQTLLEIPGEVEIVSATVSDMEFNSWTPTINGTAKTGNVPVSFALNQNFPNPFNPTTNISFSLPFASDYTLSIFNVTGQLVEEKTGHSEAGAVTLSWDGAKHASGVYLYRLSAGAFTQTKKMMLLK